MAGRFKIENPPSRNDCHVVLGFESRVSAKMGPFPPKMCFSGTGLQLLLPGVDMTMYKVMVPIGPESAGRGRLGGYRALVVAAEIEKGVKLAPRAFEKEIRL